MRKNKFRWGNDNVFSVNGFPRKLDFYSIILSFYHRVLKYELYINIFYIILKGIQSIVFLYTFYVPLYWNEIDL